MTAGQRAADAVLEATDQRTEGTEFSAMRKAIIAVQNTQYVGEVMPCRVRERFVPPGTLG